ncbi:MAG: hypothetical protein K2P51_02805 [Rhabdochlamydiaceae bacterium]|nr:hypothetical protein [Rhabdochlamydiaceae bacterium]
MKKIILLVLSLTLLSAASFAENLILKNQTLYPGKNQKTRLAIQWANSAKQVDAYNQSMIHGSKMDPDTMQFLTQTGKVKLNIPQNAEYFRILAWSTDTDQPDHLTNWVDIVPNKTYTLKEEHLAPSVLILGSGC